ncbi:MAG: glycosyltransferase [Isosphaeraceae bacterium]
MPEPRISALILAKNEAHNLPRCLDSLHWTDEVVVVVDRASRDATQAIAQQRADLVSVRTFDDFASQAQRARPRLG